jgi:hypothetical protein
MPKSVFLGGFSPFGPHNQSIQNFSKNRNLSVSSPCLYYYRKKTINAIGRARAGHINVIRKTVAEAAGMNLFFEALSKLKFLKPLYGFIFFSDIY